MNLELSRLSLLVNIPLLPTESAGVNTVGERERGEGLTGSLTFYLRLDELRYRYHQRAVMNPIYCNLISFPPSFQFHSDLVKNKQTQFVISIPFLLLAAILLLR